LLRRTIERGTIVEVAAVADSSRLRERDLAASDARKMRRLERRDSRWNPSREPGKRWEHARRVAAAHSFVRLALSVQASRNAAKRPSKAPRARPTPGLR
jgi:hypothetical protein